jgi:hypothetical protein
MSNITTSFSPNAKKSVQRLRAPHSCECGYKYLNELLAISLMFPAQSEDAVTGTE